MAEQSGAVWQDRKRIVFGLKWSFTKYQLTEDRLLVSTGLFTTKEEEIRIYRILDVTLRRTLEERIFGLGTLHLCTADRSTPELDIRRVKNSAAVRDMLSGMVEKARAEKGIIGREFFGGDGDDPDDVGHV